MNNWLGYPDSNQEKQNQNLLCYHYTISQSAAFIAKSGAKVDIICDARDFFAFFNLEKHSEHKPYTMFLCTWIIAIGEATYIFDVEDFEYIVNAQT